MTNDKKRKLKCPQCGTENGHDSDCKRMIRFRKQILEVFGVPEVQIKSYGQCRECDGDGHIELLTSFVECDVCDGTGVDYGS